MADNNVNDHTMLVIMDEEGDVTAESNVNMQSSSENYGKEVEFIVSSIRGKLCQQPPLPVSIFRIPEVLRRHNEKVFVPTIVSIGPFHYGNKNLQSLEETKLRYLNCLLDRKPTPDTRLEHLVEVIKSTEQYCRDCYSEKIDMSSEKFVEMMVVDGCFIVELLRKRAREVPREEHDPIFNSAWMYSILQHDLFLLENQLPWKVVYTLFHQTKASDERGKSSLLELTVNFFRSARFGRHSQLDEALMESNHLLDVLRNYLVASYPQAKSNYDYWESIASVTELRQAGVIFKVRNTCDSLLDITFNNGVMEIPRIDIEDYGESILRNLIAYEQCNTNIRGCMITSYAAVLDNLINSSKDADFLIQKGIITTPLSKEDIARFFNRLYTNTVPRYFTYSELTENVNAYYKVRWHRWQTILRRDYFGNPWSVLSLAAALLILAFTFIQTVSSIKSYTQKGQN